MRIGCVSYLNAKPLIRGLDPSHLALDTPSALSRRFADGEFHAALLPLAEILHHPSPRIVDGISISCDGAVKSVILAGTKPLHECKSISQDAASVTSNALLQILLHSTPARGAQILPPGSQADARLIIGNPALELYQTDSPIRPLLDLGSTWKAFTGLPFVFAAWQLAPQPSLPTSDATTLAEELREARARGLREIPAIAQEYPHFDAPADYLTTNIKYGLGSAEKEAISLFTNLCRGHGILANAPDIKWF